MPYMRCSRCGELFGLSCRCWPPGLPDTTGTRWAPTVYPALLPVQSFPFTSQGPIPPPSGMDLEEEVR